MQAFLADYMVTYGYATIFLVVLLLELGLPGLPNELVLLYFGYISKKSNLSYPLVISIVILADTIGSFLLYLLFYYFKNLLISIKPNWLNLPEQKIQKLKQRILLQNGRTLFFAKLTPFIRSYLPAVAGLLQVQRSLYMRIVIIAAIIWSGGLVTAGWIMQWPW